MCLISLTLAPPQVECVAAIARCIGAGDQPILDGLALMTDAQQRDLQNYSSRSLLYRMPAWWVPVMHDQVCAQTEMESWNSVLCLYCHVTRS